jgi:hypothetical protein
LFLILCPEKQLNISLQAKRFGELTIVEVTHRAFLGHNASEAAFPKLITVQAQARLSLWGQPFSLLFVSWGA